VPAQPPQVQPPYHPLPPAPGLDDSTGTFTRVLLTGLGGETGTQPAVAPSPPAHGAPPGPPGSVGGWPRLVATIRRLAARLAALRGDERTALVAVGAVVGVVLLALAVLVVVVRLTSADPAPARPPTAAAAATASKQPTAAPSGTPSPSRSPAPPTGGSFAARHSGYCLSAPVGRVDDGAQLVQRPCGVDRATAFRLVLREGRSDAYALVDTATGKCVDVAGAAGGDGAPVVQWDCHYGDNQTFELRPVTGVDGAGGWVQIVAGHSGKCLDVANVSRDEGAPIQQWECHDAAGEAATGNQSWKLSGDRAR
jgi:Ricin-type beta-trefoil lectin domain-like